MFILPAVRDCWYTRKLFSRRCHVILLSFSFPAQSPPPSVHGGDLCIWMEKTHSNFHIHPAGQGPGNPGVRPRRGEQGLVTVSGFLPLARVEHSSLGSWDHGILRNCRQVVSYGLCHCYSHVSIRDVDSSGPGWRFSQMISFKCFYFLDANTDPGCFLAKHL